MFTQCNVGLSTSPPTDQICMSYHLLGFGENFLAVHSGASFLWLFEKDSFVNKVLVEKTLRLPLVKGYVYIGIHT